MPVQVESADPGELRAPQVARPVEPYGRRVRDGRARLAAAIGAGRGESGYQPRAAVTADEHDRADLATRTVVLQRIRDGRRDYLAWRPDDIGERHPRGHGRPAGVTVRKYAS